MKHFYPIGSFAAILTAAVLLTASFSPECMAQNAKHQQETKALGELRAEFGDRVKIKFNKATNKASFVRLSSDVGGGLNKQTAGALPADQAAEFFKARGSIFGVRDFDRELSRHKPVVDELGQTHLSFAQTYKGVPVFGAVLRTHFNQEGELRSVNGLFVPDIDLNPTPGIKPDGASATALAKISEQNTDAKGLRVQRMDLLVYRKGLMQGVSGKDHLAYRVEVGNGNVREFVFVDAHNGKIVEQVTGKHEAMDRRLFSGYGSNELFPTASYPSTPFWLEGNAFPTGNPLADEILSAKKETYDLYKNAFGRDSFDGAGGRMNSFFDFGFFGNAFATFIFDESTSSYVPVTAYGDDTISDDIVAHEWTHIYTAYTDGLVYAYQPGALNESYSDIIGETVDLLNNRGLFSPDTNRTSNGEFCSVSSKPLPLLTVNSPAGVSGTYEAAYSYFGPEATAEGITSQLVLANDGSNVTSDACLPLVNASEVNGKIAVVDVSASACYVATSVQNAEAAGAIGVLLINPIEYGDSRFPWAAPPGMTAGITSISIGYTLGNTIKAQLASGVNATLRLDAARSADNSYRWLLGEDSSYEGVYDAIRDLYRPKCYMHPGKTSDAEYMCLGIDSGGVHFNSGVPNHTFALLVDGGTYNGQTIEPLGLTKAAHIYYRAKAVYQHPLSDFADHAEALEAAADDLKNKKLNDLLTGDQSSVKIKNADLNTVHKATLATELREPPAQCNYALVVGNNPPDDSCNAPHTRKKVLLSEDFERDPTGEWSVNRDVEDESTFAAPDWAWNHDLPDRREGSAFFAQNFANGCDLPYPSQAGVLHLTSPSITIPSGLASGPRVSFDHYVATEPGYDGAQVLISVNGGEFQLVSQSAFIYSGHNAELLGYDFSTNPRYGQRAFTGVNGGELDGSWGTSIIDLSGYAQSGDTVRLRFDLSSDYCYGSGLGWYVDNVNVYACDRRGN